MSAIKKIESTSLSLFYEDAGYGFPIILLHGFGEDRSIWDEQVVELSKKYRVLVPDLPGTGKSIMHNELPITIESMAGAVYTLLHHEVIDQCILFGHSMGGYISLCFAEKYPQYLKAWGLIHATAYADSAEKKQTRTKGIEVMENYGGQAFLKNTIPNLFSEESKKRIPAEISTLINKSASFQTTSLQAYYATMRDRPDRRDILEQTHAPVLFIAGTEDIAAPLTDLLAQSHLPNKSYIHVLENVGHMSMLEAPHLLNQYLLQFLEEVIDRS
jgi:pimeloyl-ACP methyl ester carboxylesterase